MSLSLLLLLQICWKCVSCYNSARSYEMAGVTKQNDMFGVYGGYIPCERGTCTSRQFCEQAGGVASGYCYMGGFSSPGVCCMLRESCGQSTSDDRVLFRNPNFPQPNIGPMNCAFTVNVKPGICGVRVDFLDAMFAPVVADSCAEDSITILHLTQRPIGYNVPFCGLISGTSTVIQVTEQSKIQVVVTTQSPQVKWVIQVAQINCKSVHPPDIQGCGIANEPIGIAKDNEMTTSPAIPSSTPPALFFRRKMTFRSLGEPRILGGFPTPNVYPWVVALYRDQILICGGSLITDQWVLTAGHCITIKDSPILVPNVQRFSAVLGATNLFNREETWRMVRNIINIVRHPEYIAASNDIALLRLSQPVVYTRFIRPVCLPRNAAEQYDGQTGIIAGWGLTSNNFSTESPFLMSTSVLILKNSQCKQMWSRINVVIENYMLCAGQGEQATCRGDSGGPLIVREGPDAFYSIVAITSFGAPPTCGNPNFPDVWTRVTYYLDWIYLVLTDVSFQA